MKLDKKRTEALISILKFLKNNEISTFACKEGFVSTLSGGRESYILVNVKNIFGNETMILKNIDKKINVLNSFKKYMEDDKEDLEIKFEDGNFFMEFGKTIIKENNSEFSIDDYYVNPKSIVSKLGINSREDMNKYDYLYELDYVVLDLIDSLSRNFLNNVVNVRSSKSENVFICEMYQNEKEYVEKDNVIYFKIDNIDMEDSSNYFSKTVFTSFLEIIDKNDKIAMKFFKDKKFFVLNYDPINVFVKI